MAKNIKAWHFLLNYLLFTYVDTRAEAEFDNDISLKSKSWLRKLNLKWEIRHLEDFPAIIRMSPYWIPCKERSECNEEERSMQFTIKIKMLESERWFATDRTYQSYVDVWILPGRIYEVVLTSIDNSFNRVADIEEVFMKPASSAVHSVNVVQLSNSSILITWKPPGQSHHQLFCYIIRCLIKSKNSWNEVTFSDSNSAVKAMTLATNKDSHEQIKITNLKPAIEYTFFIIPITGSWRNNPILEFGLEYAFTYILKPEISKSDFPWTAPKMRYMCRTFSKNSTCRIFIQWLPCGDQFDCKNSKPGTAFNLQIKNENKSQVILDEVITNSDYKVTDVKKDETYNVTVQSVDGNGKRISNKISTRINTKSCSTYNYISPAKNFH